MIPNPSCRELEAIQEHSTPIERIANQKLLECCVLECLCNGSWEEADKRCVLQPRTAQCTLQNNNFPFLLSPWSNPASHVLVLVLEPAAETFMNYVQMKPKSVMVFEAAVVAVMVWTGMTERPVSSLLQSLLAGGVRSALISPCTVLMLWLRSPPWLYLTCFTPPTGSQRTLCLSCSDRWRLPYDLRLYNINSA